MKRYSTAEIAKIINGQLFQTEQPEYNTIDKITIDSRTISEFHNSMFFALISDRNDGHHYLKNAWNKGIRVFVISQLPADFISFKNSIFIKVANTLTALQKLAAFKRSGFSKEIIAITGSNGKTIIKEWLYDLLRGHFLIIRSPKSYNSQVGVPLSVWLLEEKHTLGIFESGISLPGEMEKLAQIIQPEIGIFTNIGPSHQENFDTVEQKIREKIKLFRNTKKLVFCSDQAKTFNIIHPFCQQNNIDEFKWSLTNKNSPIYIVPFKGESTTAFEANYKGHSYKFTIPFTDDSSIENACQCFAAILALNLNPQQFLTKFKTLSSVAMRLEIKQGINNSLLINDYYNSDINSLSIALSVMENQAKKKPPAKSCYPFRYQAIG